VLLGARNEKAGRAAAQKIGPTATFLKVDVSDPASTREAAAELAKMVDHLDVLVNNAGIIVDGDDAILKATPDQFETTMRTNTLGPLMVAQAFQTMLANSPAPRIVNVSSSGGQLHDGADGWSPVYCISKTALNGVTSQLAAALPKFAVNSICPGWVRTDYGWGQCDSLGRTRRGRNCLARGRGTAKSHRQIFAGSQSDSVVTTLVPSRSNEQLRRNGRFRREFYFT